MVCPISGAIYLSYRCVVVICLDGQNVAARSNDAGEHQGDYALVSPQIKNAGTRD
jgi:hypothetical protein